MGGSASEDDPDQYHCLLISFLRFNLAALSPMSVFRARCSRFTLAASSDHLGQRLLVVSKAPGVIISETLATKESAPAALIPAPGTAGAME